MKLTERKLRSLIRNTLFKQESLIDISKRQHVKENTAAGTEESLTNFEKNASKIKKIVDVAIKDEKDRFIRKLYANNLADRVREEVSSQITKNKFNNYNSLGYGNITKKELINYIIPKDRKQRYTIVNTKDKSNPYYLNYFAKVVFKIKQKIEDLVVQLDIDSQELAKWYRNMLDKGSDVGGVFRSTKKPIEVFTAKMYRDHIGPAQTGGFSEFFAKIKSATGLISDDEEGWSKFDSAVRMTISHEFGHAWDIVTSKKGYDKITNIARRSLTRLNKVISNPIEINRDYAQQEKSDETKGKSSGSQKVKAALMPVIKKGYHVEGEGGVPRGLPMIAPRSRYINLSSGQGQTETLTRIRMVKQIPGSTQGVGIYKPEHIKYMREYDKAKLEVAGLSDVIDLIFMLRDDAADKEVADAFNKVVASG
jgi:hypothetical protein